MKRIGLKLATRTLATGVLLGSVIAAGLGASPASAATSTQSQVRELGVSAGQDVFGRLVKAQSAGRATSLWMKPAGTCRRCLAGPALAAAALAARTDDPFYTRIAVKTFDGVIATGLDPRTGGIYPAGSRTRVSDIETTFFAGSLGLATVLLGDRLDAAHRASYTKVVTGAARYLQRNGNLSWYTNGNIVLANSVTMRAAYRLTGDPAYLAMYRTAIRFAQHPGKAWPGRGLVVTKAPAKADGSDGAGYFTEEAAGRRGYDPDYGMLQGDLLVQLDVLGAPEARRLLNLVFNSTWKRVNTKVWTVDVSSGSRHPEAGRIFGLQTAAGTYLGTHGRADLARHAAPAAAAVLGEVAKNVGNYQPGLQFAYGTIWVSTTV